VPNTAQAHCFFRQRDAFIEVTRFALVIKANIERQGQVIQVFTTARVSLGAQRHGFTEKLCAFVQIINAAALCKP
jgi:hypothetical protein